MDSGSRAGAYLRHHMTTAIEAIRFAGDIVMVLGAWFYKPLLIIVGLVVIVMAWCSGGFRKGHSRPGYSLANGAGDDAEHP